MKKVLFILPLLLISIVSCSNANNNVSSPASNVVINKNNTSSERKSYYLYAYQVFETKTGSNEWANPRIDTKFEFYYDEELTLSNIKESFNTNDVRKAGYYSLQFIVYDYTNLDTKVPNKFYLTENTKIYYGYRMKSTIK